MRADSDRDWKRSVLDKVGFFGQYLQNPLQVGSLTPSSGYLVERMLEGLDLSNAHTIVEFGPGTGAFTRRVLERIGPHTLYYAMEPNPAFQDHLRRTYPRVQVIGDRAERATTHLSTQLHKVDAVISGLPFSLMTNESLAGTVASISNLLRPGGAFRTFIYCHVYHLPKLARLRRLLAATHRRMDVVQALPNIPPAMVLRCVK